MTTAFPGGLDAFTNPTSGDTLASPDHAAQHADVNDAVEALQAKVGVDGSAVTTSLDYKVAQLEASAVTDHGALSGLSDDDHPQYVLKSTEFVPTTFVYESSTTFNPASITNGTPKAFRLTVTGGGGGGGGAVSDGTSGGGGGAGGTFISPWIPWSTLVGWGTLTITVGAGGAGASGGTPLNGTAGGTTTISAAGNPFTLYCSGGGAGSGGASYQAAYGGFGGGAIASGGVLNQRITASGGHGGSGVGEGNYGANAGGTGGASYFGGGGYGGPGSPYARSGVGGYAYGSGGGGGQRTAFVSAGGGPGANGVVMLEII